MLETPEFNIRQSKGPLSKFDHDLFDEGRDTVEPIIRVKRFIKGKIEKWKIFSDSKQVIVLHGSSLNKREKEFLRTSDGMNFLLRSYKNGITTAFKMKISIKLEINKRTCQN